MQTRIQHDIYITKNSQTRELHVTFEKMIKLKSQILKKTDETANAQLMMKINYTIDD